MCRGPLILTLLLTGPAARAQDPAARARAVEQLIQAVVEQAEPSVVSVVVSHAKYPDDGRPDRSPPGRLGGYTPPPVNFRFGPPAADKLDLSDPLNVADNLFGSGVVLDPAGLVLTNYHLIEGATKVYVRGRSGKGAYADIHAADARSDLAVLRTVDRIPDLKAVELADVRVAPGPRGEKPTVAKGAWVVALGHPAAAGVGDGSPSASWGVVSNLRRRVAGPADEKQPVRPLYHHAVLIQTDARVTLGCSGGGLFDLDGKLVGLTTPLAAVTGSETAGGFALPMEANYRRIVDTLRAGREVEYGFLGVQVDPSSAVSPGGRGLTLAQVTPGTPAWQAGLCGSRQPGRDGWDVLLAVDGKPIREPDDLFLHIGSALAGTKVTLTVQRGTDRPRSVEVTLAKYAHDLPWIASARPPAVHGLRVEYPSVKALQWSTVPVGVLIKDVEPGSPAEAKFSPLGRQLDRWVITHVNGKPVTNPAEFADAARKGSVQLRLAEFDPVTGAEDRGSREITLP